MYRLHTRHPVLFLLCFGLISVGCGDSSKTSWGGTYTISSWTENEASCDAQGASIADDHKAFMNVDYCTVRLGGYSYSTLQLVECADETACAGPVCPEDGESSLFQGGISFGSGSDSSGWFGESAAAETSNDGGCYGIYGARTLKKQEDGSLRLEIKTHASFDYEKEAQWCTETDKVKALGPNEPCESLEVVILTPVAPAAAE